MEQDVVSNGVRRNPGQLHQMNVKLYYKKKKKNHVILNHVSVGRIKYRSVLEAKIPDDLKYKKVLALVVSYFSMPTTKFLMKYNFLCFLWNIFIVSHEM